MLDLIGDHVKPGVRRLLDVAVPLVIAAIGAFLAYWGAVLLMDGLHIKAAGAELPQSINYLPLAVGGALMVLFALNRAFLALTHAPVADTQPAPQEGDL